jgi:hypothetical protein
MPEKKETAKRPDEREKRPARDIEDLPKKEPTRERAERVKGGWQESPERLENE